MYKMRYVFKGNKHIVTYFYEYLSKEEKELIFLVNPQLATKPHCSFCDSDDVSQLSSFGTAQLVSQFYCNQCKSVFEFIRWQKVKQKAL